MKVGDIVIGKEISKLNTPTILPDTVVGFSQQKYQVPLPRLGTIHHVDHIVETASEKADLYKQTGADAIDMESYVLAEIAQEKKIPFLTIRAVSDEAKHNLDIGFEKFISKSKGVSPVKAGWHLITHPRAAYNVFQIQKASRVAAKMGSNESTMNSL